MVLICVSDDEELEGGDEDGVRVRDEDENSGRNTGAKADVDDDDYEERSKEKKKVTKKRVTKAQRKKKTKLQDKAVKSRICASYLRIESKEIRKYVRVWLGSSTHPYVVTWFALIFMFMFDFCRNVQIASPLRA